MPRSRAGWRWLWRWPGWCWRLLGFVAGDANHWAVTVIVDVPWVPSMGIHYLLAADGISRVLVLLTGLAAVAGVLFSWNIEAADQ